MRIAEYKNWKKLKLVTPKPLTYTFSRSLRFLSNVVRYRVEQGAVLDVCMYNHAKAHPLSTRTAPNFGLG
jgi:hypothetical protein